MELTLKQLDKVRRWLADLQQEVEEINDRLNQLWQDYIYDGGGSVDMSAYDVDGPICLVYSDCARCPLNEACDFYQMECKEAKDCSTCPKVKVCVANRNPALILYLFCKGEDISTKSNAKKRRKRSAKRRRRR
jgi:hypothetical protein